MGAMFATAFVLVCLLPVVSSLSSVDGEHFTMERPKRCSRQRVFGKISANCNGLQLDSVPPNLSTDIQVLDLSFNRIRELTTSSFSRYTSVELLYLDDNMISFIEDDAFVPLQRLEVLVLSLSGINKFPSSVTSLPVLWKLDLSNNRFTPGGLDALGQFPLENNIKVLSLASCYLKQLPPLDRFLRMYQLNISGNPLEHLNATQFASMCNLDEVDLGETFPLLSNCDCLLLRRWIQDEGLSVITSQGVLQCATLKDGDEEKCLNSNSTLQAQQLRGTCNRHLKMQAQATYATKVWIYVGVGLMIAAVLALFMICFIRRRQAHAHNLKNSMAEKHVAESLINSSEDNNTR